MQPVEWPHGKAFAFTILDDTDAATVDNVGPVYRLLEELGMRTTKTVWPLGCPEGNRASAGSQTLDDPDYRAWVLELRRRGFELTWCGAAMETSPRARTLQGLERFHEVFGEYPRIHVNHAFNRENLYWGLERVDLPLLKALVQRAVPTPTDFFAGHRDDSPFWWGDLAARHVQYCRNFTFDEVNLFRVNPSLPYHDDTRPLVRWWFSCAEAQSRTEFNHLLRPEKLDRLEREGGCCIVATQLGRGFLRGGEVDPVFRRRLEAIAARDGWFVPVGTLLDWLRLRRDDDSLPVDEWDRMQWRWARDLVRRKDRRARAMKKGKEAEPAAAGGWA